MAPLSDRMTARRLALALAGVLALLTGLAGTTGTLASFVDPGAVSAGLGAQPFDDRLVEVSSSGSHTLARGANGELYAWGRNTMGELGDGTVETRDRPVRISLPGGDVATQVSAGVGVSIALGASGIVYTWGEMYGPVPVAVAGVPSSVAGVSAGGKFFLAWTRSGALYSWGNNGSGRLGRGVLNQDDMNPGRVNVTANAVVAGATSGRYGGVAWLSSGGVFTFGADLGGTTGRAVPAPAGDIRKVSLGYDTLLLLTGAGTVYWSTGQTAFTSQGLSGVVDVSVGLSESHTTETYLAITPGSLYAWGSNTYGQWGSGGTNGWTAQPQPVSLGGIGNPRLAAAESGADHSVLLTSDGRFTAAGSNAVGQLGNGPGGAKASFTPPATPVTWNPVAA